MNRLTVWRQRLDVTTNWAIILATALSTFTLGAADVPHYTLLLGLALFSFSLLIEGRRYRHLHHSKWRLYLLESGLFAQLLDPDEQLLVRLLIAFVQLGRSVARQVAHRLVQALRLL